MNHGPFDIGLLILKPGHGEEPVTCRLPAVLDYEPAYGVLCYNWGDASIVKLVVSMLENDSGIEICPIKRHFNQCQKMI